MPSQEELERESTKNMPTESERQRENELRAKLEELQTKELVDHLERRARERVQGEVNQPQCNGPAPAVAHVLQFFTYDHLKEPLREVSMKFSHLAKDIASGPQNTETTVALRKLLEAKGAAVRAMLVK